MTNSTEHSEDFICTKNDQQSAMQMIDKLRTSALGDNPKTAEPSMEQPVPEKKNTSETPDVDAQKQKVISEIEKNPIDLALFSKGRSEEK